MPPISKITAVSSGGRPVLASIFTAVLLSLAGIPATMGFIGKFYILASGANAAAWPLMVVLVLTSVIGLFYYLRIVVTLFSDVPERQSSIAETRVGQRFCPRRTRSSAHMVWRVPRATAQSYPSNDRWAQLM